MIKNIIFDLGGVMIDFNPARSLADHFLPEHRQIVDENVFKSNEWQEMDRGAISVEQALEIMCRKIPKELHEEVFKMVLEREAEMPPIEEMYAVVESLKNNGYKIYLLSNCPDWFESFVPSVPALKFFDGFIISAHEKVIKPNKEIYNRMFEKFSIHADECFFIDDSPANIKTALELGMHAHCFADRNFNALITHMNNEGIKI